VTFLVVAVYGETVERAKFAMPLSLYAVPLLFTIIWALGETVGGWMGQRANGGTEGRRKRIA
jgi:hypothetical protein